MPRVDTLDLSDWVDEVEFCKKDLSKRFQADATNAYFAVHQYIGMKGEGTQITAVYGDTIYIYRVDDKNPTDEKNTVRRNPTYANAIPAQNTLGKSILSRLKK